MGELMNLSVVDFWCYKTNSITRNKVLYNVWAVIAPPRDGFYTIAEIREMSITIERGESVDSVAKKLHALADLMSANTVKDEQ